MTSEKLLEGSRFLTRNRSELSIHTSSEISSKKMKEDKKINLLIINDSKFDAGKEITQGIQSIDSAREQLISARKAIKNIHLTKLKRPLLKLAD